MTVQVDLITETAMGGEHIKRGYDGQRDDSYPKWDGTRFHHVTHNGLQVTAYAFTSGIFRFTFSDRGWVWTVKLQIRGDYCKGQISRECVWAGDTEKMGVQSIWRDGNWSNRRDKITQREGESEKRAWSRFWEPVKGMGTCREEANEVEGG